LFFQDADSVSVHTLGWASHEILARHPNSPGSLLHDIADQSPESSQARAELEEARNFFKHYYKAPLKTFKFIENLNEWLLIDCGQMYTGITGKALRETYGLNAWVSMKRNVPILNHPVLVAYLRELNPTKKQFLQMIDSHPDLRKPEFE
jgi:hypothetical protein